MRGHVSAGFFRCDVLLLRVKHSGFRHIVATCKCIKWIFWIGSKVLLRYTSKSIKIFTLRTCNIMMKTTVFTLQKQDVTAKKACGNVTTYAQHRII